MRRLIHLITAMALLASPAVAAPACPSAADQSTYEVLALRTQMIFLPYKCGREKEYNENFVKRFQPALQANERAVLAYFRRVYGSAGLNQMSRFTGELANALSTRANAQGTEFCGRTGWIVNEMNALHSMDELAAYAAVKDLVPTDLSMCPQGASAPRRGR
jgi:hypothetical protein